MNNSRPVTIDCQCGKKIEPFYNPITKRWILPTPPCFDCLQALEKKKKRPEEKMSSRPSVIELFPFCSRLVFQDGF